MFVTTELFKNISVRDFYKFVDAAEVNSDHPIAKAIVDHVKDILEDEHNQSFPEAKDFVSALGHGVKAIVQNKELMLDHNIVISIEAEEALAKGETMAQIGILVIIGWRSCWSSGCV
ncbi:unnamed protein product [Lathyrus sativus]|nr:unnamed protein product [Lathyrus sativus]